MARELVFCVFYGLLALLITSANIVNIVIFCGRKLRRKRTNFLFISLAVVDLLVGLLALPLIITVTLTLSVEVGVVSYRVDIITGLISIFTLAVISLERMYAIRWPFRHRTVSQRAYILAVCIPWILVIAGVIIAELIADRHLSRILISCSLILPLIITLNSYFVIWRKKRTLSQHRSALQEVQERNLAKTLLIVIGAFVVTWLPFQVINTYSIACRYMTSCKLPPEIIIYIIVFLRFSNSFVNFIVYSLRIPDFRGQLGKMYQLCRKSCNSREEDLPIPAAERGFQVQEDCGANKC